MILIHTFLTIYKLMSVVIVFVPKHVHTLMEASLVDVLVVIYWMLVELLVMVCTNF